MQVKIYGKGRTYKSNAVYKDGEVTVLKGSKIFLECDSKFNRYKDAMQLREDRNTVDSEGILLKDYTFSTPSAAAVFVAGSSRNGYDYWKVERGVSLGKYLEQKGLLVRKTRK